MQSWCKLIHIAMIRCFLSCHFMVCVYFISKRKVHSSYLHIPKLRSQQCLVCTSNPLPICELCVILYLSIAVIPPLLTEQMFLLTARHPKQTRCVLLSRNMPLGGHTTTIDVMTRSQSMSKSAIAQSKQMSRPLGTMLHINLPTRPLSSLVIVPLATWHLISQIQPL